MVKILKAICGSGFQDHFPSNGWFTVKSEDGTKKFNRLSDAVAFYQQLDKEAGLWDTTAGAQLLEFKIRASVGDVNAELHFHDMPCYINLN